MYILCNLIKREENEKKIYRKRKCERNVTKKKIIVQKNPSIKLQKIEIRNVK